MAINERNLDMIREFLTFVCNAKTYNLEQKLLKAVDAELFDSAIIYAWKIFMLFVYEKIWQIRQIEKLEGKNYETDKKAFLSKIDPNKPDKFPENHLDGDLFNLNKLDEDKKGEDFIIGRLSSVYPGVDNQYFKKAQNLIKTRHEAAHLNSLDQDESNFEYFIRELIKVMTAIQLDHNKVIEIIFKKLDDAEHWYISEQDLLRIDFLVKSKGCNEYKHIYLAKLISRQEFSQNSIENIKQQAMEYFLRSRSFAEAQTSGRLILLPLIPFLTREDIKKILLGVLDKRGHAFNQILSSAGMEDTLWALYDFSRNTFPDIENDWLAFADGLEREGYAESYAILIKGIHDAESLAP